MECSFPSPVAFLLISNFPLILVKKREAMPDCKARKDLRTLEGEYLKASHAFLR